MFMGFGVQLFSIVWSIVFFGILIAFFVILIRNLRQWHKNNHSPRLTVEATVVAKRTNVSHHHQAGTHAMSSTSTSYFATFQVESGDRMELPLSGSEYGLLAEGDRGKLTFQGTRYLSFARQ